jgi:carbamoyl-phosphate synthase large subunit
VLVTGVGGRAVGHQILHALSLCADRYRIVCCDADRFSFGLYATPYRYLVPVATAPDYLDTILDIVARESVAVILPGTEAEVVRLAQARDRLAAAGCHLVASPSPVLELCFDKAALYTWLAREGLGVPISSNADSWQSMVARTGFPIIAKPSKGSGGSRQVEILADPTEVEDYIAHFSGDRALIVFQEYVGTAESEYTVGVIVGSDGKAADSIVIRRHLIGLSLGSARSIDGKRYAISTGYSQGFIVAAPEIQRYCEALVERLGLIGPANVQLRTDEKRIKVFEVHPRFSGTTSIRADAGFNEPDRVIRNQLFTEPVGRQNHRTNVAAIRAFQNILVPMDEMSRVTPPGAG